MVWKKGKGWGEDDNHKWARAYKDEKEDEESGDEPEIITSEWEEYDYIEPHSLSPEFWEENEEEWDSDSLEEKKQGLGRVAAILALVFFGFTVIAGLFNALAGFPLGAYLESRALEDDPRVEEMRAGVVSVSVWEDTETKPFSRQRSGTGFNVAPSGLILTNQHVVEGSRVITVSFRHQEETKNFRVSDRQSSPYPGVDLALLSLENEHDLPYVPVAETPSEAVVKGEKVLIIGNPRGIGGLAVEGEVLQKHELSAAPHVIMEIDASIHPGHSGSPVITEAGEVVGIIYASRETAEGKRIGLAFSLENYQQIERYHE